jgi:effector-binding domain-containing protein
MGYEVTTHEVPDEALLSIRGSMTMAELPGFIGQSYAKLYGRLGELGDSSCGPPFVIYHAFGPGQVDAEVCVPLAAVVTASGEMTSRVLPGASVARTVHLGSYDSLGAAYTELYEWIGDRGFEVVGVARERYLNEPGPDVPPADYITEIDVPIAPAKVPAGVA